MGKKYNEAAKLVDRTKFYTIDEGVALAQKTSISKFDGSIELIIKFNLDTTKAEQQFRGNLVLPHYYGKKQKVLVIDDAITKAKADENGIEFFGGAEKIADLKEGNINYDIIITTPKFMIELSKLGKILGPKGLMPNPKLGTVTPDTLKAFKEFAKGKTPYRTDTYGNIHMLVGKVSSNPIDVSENVKFIVDYFSSKRPSTVKGDFVQKIYICSSMGPSVKILVK
ncbi:50S ribosomal protein L1 [Bacilli bacterium]|nr:50S ribosomal protein L1 [Bacilli bacterium]